MNRLGSVVERWKDEQKNTEAKGEWKNKLAKIKSRNKCEQMKED